MSDLDVLFIHPGQSEALYQGLGKHVAARETPLWAGMLATYARHHGFTAAIIDAEAEEYHPQEVAREVWLAQPRLVVVVVYSHQPSASTQNMTSAGEIVRRIKEVMPPQKILMVGGHVAALTERTLKEESCDYVALGEGPVTVVELLQAMDHDVTKVRGLGYRHNGGILFNPAPPLVPLDERLVPAYDLMPMKKYRAHNWHCFGNLPRQPYASLYTTLGCPYHCTFCAVQAPFRDGQGGSVNSYRRLDPHVVGAQLEWLQVAYGVKNVRISDEMFVLHREHVHGICQEIIRRRLDLNLWAYGRVDTVKDPETLTLMKRAGFRWICLGFESASQTNRAGVGKVYDDDVIRLALRNIRESGLYLLANYIVGLPYDTMETMEATLQEAISLRPEFFNLYSAMAYPGSQWYRDAVESKVPLPPNWGAYSQHAKDCLPLPTKTLTGADVLRFRDQAFRRFFDRPEYLKQIEETFGVETVKEITDLLGRKPLERTYA